jgi:single-stranded-DNA-specific exonuclease
MVKSGIKRIRAGSNLGLSALASAARLNPAKINAGDIGFMLGPRLNAAGRLESASKAFDLLVTSDAHQAGLIAQELDDLNRKRQDIVGELVDIARNEINTEEQPSIILSFNPRYEQGVVGLVASRLVEDFYRPAIIGQDKGTYIVASCRSIPEFHITQALDRVSELFDKHGGHQMAAGFTIQKDYISELRTRLSEIASESFEGLELRPTLTADMEIELRRLPADILERIELLEPTGQENPGVVFISRNLNIVQKRAVGRDRKHLQLKLKDAHKVYPAIAFNKGHLISSLTDQVDVLYRLSRNEYNGYVSTQLHIVDIKNVS